VKRGHAAQLSISDENHHVTEAIGYMYEDDDEYRRDSRHLSYASFPQGETLSTRVPFESSPSPPHPTLGRQTGDISDDHDRNLTRPMLAKTASYEREGSHNTPPLNRTPSDTATASFPLNDIDYETDPAAVAQELVNLAAIRRMSMDVTGDPDLPSFGSNFQVPSIPPSASADENDASRLFWVPARLHPELAPKEFKTFVESKTEQIRRRSRDFSSSSGLERQVSGGGELRRTRSKLSRQIDNGSGYTDGAERLERKKSESRGNQSESANPNLHDLGTLVDDAKNFNRHALSLLGGVESLDIAANEDRPILPPTPAGSTLKRSTRTQYRKGSLKKGERLPYSKRVGRLLDGADLESVVAQASASPAPTDLTADEALSPVLGISRASTDPILHSPEIEENQLRQVRSAAILQGSSLHMALDAGSDQKPSAETSTPQPRQWHSRISSNGRSTLNIPPSAQKVPQIVETPPQEENHLHRTTSLQNNYLPERTSSHDSYSSPAISSSSVPEPNHGNLRRPSLQRQPPGQKSQTLNDMVAHPSPLPGNSTRTDSLSFIPTLTEDKKADNKKVKDKKEHEGRKSSWHWLLGTEEKEKEKKKDGDAKKSKSNKSGLAEKAVDKHDNTRLDVLQASIDSVPRGRESLVLERADSRLEEERRKESARKSSGESKKDRDPGLLSSIFGGVKKKSSGDGHKKHSSRNLSPDPTPRELRPDMDYAWTRFSILEERAIYRMAHIKLANPRRPLYSQVLLSNFMYSYLAKVQQMHPQMMLPTSAAQKVQKSKEQQQHQPQQMPDEYSQYQRYQEVSTFPTLTYEIPTNIIRISNTEIILMTNLKCMITNLMTAMITTEPNHAEAGMDTRMATHMAPVTSITDQDIPPSVMLLS
jgi:hypothetical protein